MLYGIYGKVNPGSIPGSVYHFPLLTVTKVLETQNIKPENKKVKLFLNNNTKIVKHIIDRKPDQSEVDFISKIFPGTIIKRKTTGKYIPFSCLKTRNFHWYE